MEKTKKLARFAAVVPLLAMMACKPVVLDPAGDVALQQRDILVISTFLMLLIIIPVIVLTLVFAWKYRASNKNEADYDPDFHHSTQLEIVIWAAPLLIIVCLGALTWVGTHLTDPYTPLHRISATEPLDPDVKPVEVEVVALDWKWLFIYPEEGIATVNELTVPENTPVHFKITATSVMNAFYIPDMAGMIYAMAGMETQLWGVLNKTGDFRGIAAHYNGAGFPGMKFMTHSVTADDYRAWIEKVKAGQGDLTRATYLELEKPSENVPPATYAAVDKDLFARIVNMCVEDGKMCMSEMAAIDKAGGTGLAGAVNVKHLAYDSAIRRGNGTPAANGVAPLMVMSYCTPADSARMFGSDEARAVEQVDQTPLKGHGLPKPAGILGGLRTNLTLLAPAEGGDRKL